MQGLILAAGMGKRLKHLTQNNTKCMVKVNGETLIERMLSQLDNQNLDKIVVVVGYEGKKLIDFISTLSIKTPIEYVENNIYDKTNNIYSLYLAKDYLLKDDTILLESDLIFEESILTDLIADERETLALVDKYESWMDGTCVKLGKYDSIDAFIPGKKFNYSDISEYYKTVNIYKFSKRFSTTHYVPFLDAYSKALGNNEYYEQVLRVITMLDDPEIVAKKLNGQLWYEIDDIQDLDIASSMFASDGEQKIKMIESRFGGYWRYPKLIDFCYLVNPYFPPKKLLDEMKASFDALITQYPSGMKVNSLLAARNFNVDIDNIVVGNGAAELIKSLLSSFNGKLGFVRPTFEEYPNRYNPDLSVIFKPNNQEFSYNADDLINFFGDKGVDALVLINPDNPTGNFIDKKGVIKLCDWCQAQNITLILDESFVDFSDDAPTFIEQDILNKYSKLIVVKSISKSYGVPGIRLGILASSNTQIIARIKKDVAIWNINSFGEFFMQIYEKYKKDYLSALKKFRGARERFVKGLKEIAGLKVIPSQANYLMLKLPNGYKATALTKQLYVNFNLLIKDLSKKVGEDYIRVAIRTDEDNNKLIDALKQTLK